MHWLQSHDLGKQGTTVVPEVKPHRHSTGVMHWLQSHDLGNQGTSDSYNFGPKRSLLVMNTELQANE